MPGQPSENTQLFLDKDKLHSRTVRKLDFILLPFLSLLFLLNSLDRSNIGNAETAHFTEDVGLEEKDLNNAVALFFAFFVTLQPVGAALGRRFGMRVWVPATMSVWGLCTALHVWVRSKWQLYALRILIGVLEAGFYPTTISYLSLFYTRFEFGRRLALFYGQYAIAGACGGLLSFAVFSGFNDPVTEPGTPDRLARRHVEGKWESWQVLFMLEGSTTIIVALLGFFWLPTNPATAWFLNPEERKYAESRITQDRDAVDSGDAESEDLEEPSKTDRGRARVEDEDETAAGGDASEAHGLLSSIYSTSRSSVHTDSRGVTAHDVMSSLLNAKIYHLLACNMLSAIPVTAFSVFLPLVLKPFSPHAAIANLLTVPPYVCGAITLFAFSHWSDRSRERLKPILVSLVPLLVGLLSVTMMPDTKAWVVPRYISLCVLLSGTFIASPLTVAWISGNTPSPGKRALLLGVNGWGNLAGVFSAQIFSPRYAPTYNTSFFIATACVFLGGLGYALFRWLLIRENQQRQEWRTKSAPEEVRFEELAGSGAVDDDSTNRVLTKLARALGTLKWRKGRKWVEDFRDDGREGDEKLTFVYGL